MIIKYVLSEYPALLEDLVAKVYEVYPIGIPEAEVGSVPVPAPHNAPVLITFTGLDRVVHRVKLIGVTTGIEYHSYYEEPSENIVTIFDPIHFKIGDGGANTPAADTSVAVIPELVGLTENDFIVNKTGYGNLIPELHFVFDTDTGSIMLVSPDVFSGEGGGDEYWITKKPKAVSNLVNDSVVGKLYGGFLNVTSSVNYQASDLRKLVRMNGPNAIYTFAFGVVVPVGYQHCFTNFGHDSGGTPNPKIRFQNGPLLWGSSILTEIEIPFTSTYSFTFDGVTWNCTMYTDNSIQLPTFARIVYAGFKVIGDVNVDKFVQVDIPAQIDTNYIPVCTMRGEGDPNKNNDISYITYGKTVNSFAVAIREYSRDTQNLVLDFIIIKIN